MVVEAAIQGKNLIIVGLLTKGIVSLGKAVISIINANIVIRLNTALIPVRSLLRKRWNQLKLTNISAGHLCTMLIVIQFFKFCGIQY